MNTPEKSKISPCGHVVCCYNRYLEDRAYDNVVRAKIEPCRIAQLNARENIEAVSRMLDEECGILEEAFHAVRCVEGMFQGERVYSESSLREMDKDGFYGCIRRIQFFFVEKEFVALAYLLEILANGGSHIPLWFATRCYNFSDLTKVFMRRLLFWQFPNEERAFHHIYSCVYRELDRTSYPLYPSSISSLIFFQNFGDGIGSIDNVLKQCDKKPVVNMLYMTTSEEWPECNLELRSRKKMRVS